MVATYEKALATILSRQLRPADLSVIADEFQIVGEKGRGPEIETLTAILRKTGAMQFVALTATVENPEDLAGWMECELVQSFHRDVPLHQDVWWGGYAYRTTFGQELAEAVVTTCPPFADVLGIVDHLLRCDMGPVLVFTESRREAAEHARDFGARRPRVDVGIALAQQLDLFSEPTESSAQLQHNAGGTQQACMLALDTDPDAIGVDFIGNPTVDLGGCVVASNSPGETSIRVGGSAAVTAPCIVAAGTTQTDEGLSLTECDEPTENATPVSDPFDDLPEPPIPSEACRSVSTGTLNPGRYCGPTFNSGDYNLTSGVYVIDGGELRINANAIVSGSDVVFFLTNNATVHFNGNATINLSAPDGAAPAPLEPYTGILFYSDRDNTGGENIFNGTADSQMTGALYSPSQPVRFNGNFSSDQCLQIVALRIAMAGTADFTNQDCAASGLQNIPTSTSLRLVL